jgi:hypothetical protein
MDLNEVVSRLQNVEDQLAIERLENIYGYYMDNQMYKEAYGCFSANAESIEIADRGVFKGFEGIKRFFLGYMGKEHEMGKGHQNRKAGVFAFHMQHQGVVTVAPDGRTARGRWYLLMLQARPYPKDGPMRSVIGHGVYENDFVKENGVWKFQKMYMSLNFRSPIGDGWAMIPVIGEGRATESDNPPTNYHPYPDMRKVPMHWKHPVTRE